MQVPIEQRANPIPQSGQDGLVTRTEMLAIARQFNLFITKSTIHRWANEPGFPYAVGQDERSLLYQKAEFVSFLKRRIRQIQLER